jgi:hypothetical protein
MANRDFNEALILADALAAFANLEPNCEQRFRQLHPNFAPDTFWTSTFERGVSGVIQRSWQEDQKLVRDAWRGGFGPDECVALVVRASNMNFMSEGIQRASELLNSMDASEVKKYMESPAHFIQPKVFDLQRSVMFLHVQSWRAAYCVRCAKHFVRSAKGSKFCSQKCFDVNRSRTQLDYWRNRGTKLRAKRNKANKN